ncbi:MULTISPECIES: plasmid stabilization protein [unclassified Streptomyces]|uniref:plasmid stabilization protein n=1 Tax=unclassified Streptomyces TaxID=2593676 RepID=UPI00224FAFA7|nr:MULTISPECIES: plasmid stabilization protein [unclassified Streptomyces]MCX5143983.1 plasmid stabilization protein [Streptomyces sp. NBC_00338]WRZ68369.1 plasmid stabilization protein [Streptomyces sp. NBC_01257]
MSAGSSEKRERQYEQIKENAEEHGVSEQRAREVAARAVNRQSARSGDAARAGGTAAQDRKSAPGDEAPRSRSQGPTKAELYEEAKKQDIDGRSTMTKAELSKALGR